MFRGLLRDKAYALAPDVVVDRYLLHRMLRETRRLNRLRDATDGTAACLDELLRSHLFRPLQRRAEILRLLQTVKELRPSFICEVGAAGCGTTFLLAQAAASDALILPLDVAFTRSRAAAIKRFARQTQRIIPLKQDSHHPQAARLVLDQLKGRNLDLLYLDGDHSYEGVRSDFRLYSPMVRPGGLIVLHDIVPDYRMRYGIETASEVGGVPQFWSELKSRYAGETEEIVEDYEQDGYGIGILRWRGSERARPLAVEGDGHV